MKLRKNEQGMALITVLLIITIFTILGMSAMSFTIQSNQLRTYSDDEVEGKMLAEMGLMYFQAYLKKSLTITDVKNPTNISSIIEKIAIQKTDTDENFRVIKLPNDQGAFAFMYEDLLTVPYKDENDPEKYTQPFSKKIKLSVIGIPKNAIGDSGSRVIRKRLDATLYINTIPSPFHYAISTPSELHLFGGSNIIGNIEVEDKMLVSTLYRYNEYQFSTNKDNWELVDHTQIPNISKNQPYIKGKVFLRNSTANLYHVTSFTDNTSNKEEPPPPIINDITKPESLDRQKLKDKNILSPNNTGDISTDSPDKPGSEPPFFEKNSIKVGEIPFDRAASLKEYIQSQFVNNSSANNITIGGNSKPFALEVGEDWSKENGSDTDFSTPGDLTNPFGRSGIANIYSEQGNTENFTYQLTARLTTSWFKNNQFKQLYIGPDPTDLTKWEDNDATVEMGSTHSFDDPPNKTKTGGEFTFTGPIFIKGNLDIVGNINVKGTIFVDGNVDIRDITNLDVDYPLVIMATGKIAIYNRDNASAPLRAFIYSEKEPIEIFSIDSINRIVGGIATGHKNAYIELNSLRETATEPYKSKFTLEFDRGIFEIEQPGLPSANQIFIDTYDMMYSNYPGNIE